MVPALELAEKAKPRKATNIVLWGPGPGTEVLPQVWRETLAKIVPSSYPGGEPESF